MSEEILKALTQLFAIISKQDSGVTEREREFVIGFYQQELATDTVKEYLDLYDKYSDFNAEENEEEGSGEEDEEGKKKKKRKLTKVNEAVRVLSLCRKINKTLTQKQKVVVLFKILEMVASDRNFTSQRMEIIETVSTVFNIPKHEYKLIENFVICQSSSEDLLNSEDILVFDDEAPADGSSVKYIDSGLLDGEIIFIRIKSVGLYFTKYTGGDLIFLNGLPVKPSSIMLFSNGSVFKTPKGAPLYYSDLVSRYNDDTEKNNISLNVVDLEFRFPNGAIGLRNVNLSETSGKLIGIMGASGAGKTTLLNVLAGLEVPYSGEIKINGFNIHDHHQSKSIEGVIGYIAQDDLLIEELTVFDNLFYNAKLCFKDSTDDEIKQKVDVVLASLGLERIKHLVVGNVLNKKISGGQRKRLNIALELIREPAVLFVDEPTSGLSSKDSENVIDLLKELSLKGKLIFVVIHQPSSDIYKMFDKMWIMDTGGYPVFYGDPIEAVTYFKTAARQVGSDRGQCGTCGNVNPEQLFNILEAQVVDEYGEFTGKRKTTPIEWHELYLQNFHIERIEDIKEVPPKNLKIPTKFTQTLIFTIRDLLSKISNTQYMLINLIEAPLLAMAMALVIRYRHIDDEYIYRYNENIPAYILICIIIALFMGLTVSAEEIIKDRKIKRRESFLNLSQSSYLYSKLIILFTLSAIQTISFVLIGNTILEVQEANFTYWLVLFSVSCFANVLGLNISSAFNSAVTVYIVIPLLLIPQMILSGAIFNFDKLNNSISEKGKVPMIADIWVSRWAYEAIMVDQYKNNPYQKLFFEHEMNERISNFHVSFWIPKLEDIVKRSLTNKNLMKEDKTKVDSLKAVLTNDLAVINREFTTNPFREGVDKLGLAKVLNPENFDAKSAAVLNAYIEKLKEFYTNMGSQAMYSKDTLMAAYKQESLLKLQNDFFNEYMSDWVTNINNKEKIAIADGQLVQIADPIFYIPFRPSSLIDYRSHFFSPKKYFLGLYFDTYYFNIFIIWFFTAVLYVTLYFELLRKAVDAMGRVDFEKLFFIQSFKKLLQKLPKPKLPTMKALNFLKIKTAK